MTQLRTQVERLERRHPLPRGDEERFNGYGVMAAPFRSGHLLALRRFPATSIGPAYSSVWHRTPSGHWTMYADSEPRASCARYFGAGIDEAKQTTIQIDWTGPSAFVVRIPEVQLVWSVNLKRTPVTGFFSLLGKVLPTKLWRSPRVLGVMAPLAGRLLHAGRLGLSGTAPNGQHFMANPRSLWIIDRSTASLAGEDFGPLGPLPQQTKLGDFWIPQRPLFALGQAYFDRFDPARHVAAPA